MQRQIFSPESDKEFQRKFKYECLSARGVATRADVARVYLVTRYSYSGAELELQLSKYLKILSEENDQKVLNSHLF